MVSVTFYNIAHLNTVLLKMCACLEDLEKNNKMMVLICNCVECQIVAGNGLGR